MDRDSTSWNELRRSVRLRSRVSQTRDTAGDFSLEFHTVQRDVTQRLNSLVREPSVATINLAIRNERRKDLATMMMDKERYRDELFT